MKKKRSKKERFVQDDSQVGNDTIASSLTRIDAYGI